MNNKPTPRSSGDDHEDVEKGDLGLSEPALTEAGLSSVLMLDSLQRNIRGC